MVLYTGLEETGGVLAFYDSQDPVDDYTSDTNCTSGMSIVPCRPNACPFAVEFKTEGAFTTYCNNNYQVNEEGWDCDFDESTGSGREPGGGVHPNVSIHG